MTHGSFFWYDMVSKNPEATRTFMPRVFGWDASHAVMPDGTPYISFSSAGKLVCGLMPLSERRDFDSGRAHWMTYLEVDGLATAQSRVENSGGEILGNQQTVPDLGAYQVIRDPDGALVALVEARRKVLQQGNNWNSVVWNELICRDADRIGDFYHSIANWTISSDASNNFEYGFFTQNRVNMAGLLEMKGHDFGDIKSSWQVYIAVEDIDAAVNKVTLNGGQISAEPFDMPGIGRIAIVIEPGECQFSLLQPPS